MSRCLRLQMEIYLLYKFPPGFSIERATDVIGKCISYDAIKDVEIIKTKPSVRPAYTACLLKAPIGLLQELETITYRKDKISVTSGFKDCLKAIDHLGFKITDAIIDKFQLFDEPSKENISVKVKVNKKLAQALECHSASKPTEGEKNKESDDSEQASASSDYGIAKKEYLQFIKEKKEVIEKAHMLKKEYMLKIDQQDQVIEQAKFEIDMAELNFKIKKIEL